MNIPETICEGFVKVFFTRDGFLKHTCLFALTGLLSFISTYFRTLSENIKTGAENTDISSFLGYIIAGIIATIVISLYLAGYNLKFQHNSFNTNSNEIMPDFDGNPIGVLFKALPLMIVWGIYYVIIMVTIGFFFTNPLVILIGILMIIFAMLYFPFMQFIFVAYAKNYDHKGLFNIFLPLSYIKPAFVSLMICGLLFIFIWIAAMIIPFFAGLIMGIFGVSSTITIATGGIIGGYLGAVIQLIWVYCIVQIYRNDIEPEIYNDNL